MMTGRHGELRNATTLFRIGMSSFLGPIMAVASMPTAQKVAKRVEGEGAFVQMRILRHEEEGNAATIMRTTMSHLQGFTTAARNVAAHMMMARHCEEEDVVNRIRIAEARHGKAKSVTALPRTGMSSFLGLTTPIANAVAHRTMGRG